MTTTPTDPQDVLCTAMVKGPCANCSLNPIMHMLHADRTCGSYIGTKPCGEPVAELGPCVKCQLAHDSGFHEYPHTTLGQHRYQGRLVHITLGPTCETCGDNHGHSGTAAGHPYAPTVTERTGVGHDAEVSDEGEGVAGEGA